MCDCYMQHVMKRDVNAQVNQEFISVAHNLIQRLSY